VSVDLPTNDVPLPDQAALGSRAGADPAEGPLVEFRHAQGEFEDFFDDVFVQLQSLSMELLGRRASLNLGERPQSEELKAVADCRRQFRLCLEELQEVQAEAREAREETMRVWAEVRAAQDQSLRQYADLREVHAVLIEELQRVRSLLTRQGAGQSPDPFPAGVDNDRPGANTPGDGSPPPISDRAAAGAVLAPMTVLRPARSRRGPYGL
jgi:hypothetical protein